MFKNIFIRKLIVEAFCVTLKGDLLPLPAFLLSLLSSLNPPLPLYQTSLHHNPLFSLTAAMAVECRQPDSPSPMLPCSCFSKGQVGPSLAWCLMGSDSRVFWDYSSWKARHSNTGCFCHNTATVCFLPDSCSKRSCSPHVCCEGKDPRGNFCLLGVKRCLLPPWA